MFGGAGVYCNGTMFGLIDDDALYLKVDDTNRPDFQAEGLRPMVYDAKGKPIEMSYWRAPERLLDDPDEMLDWARKAVAVSLRTRKAGSAIGPRQGYATPPQDLSWDEIAGCAHPLQARQDRLRLLDGEVDVVDEALARMVLPGDLDTDQRPAPARHQLVELLRASIASRASDR